MKGEKVQCLIYGELMTAEMESTGRWSIVNSKGEIMATYVHPDIINAFVAKEVADKLGADDVAEFDRRTREQLGISRKYFSSGKEAPHDAPF